jgi:hypothetical protein
MRTDGSDSPRRDQTALEQVLAPLGIGPEELGIRDLNTARDRWRLRVVEHALARPLEGVGIARGMAAELRDARDSLARLIATAGRYLDLRVPDPLGAGAGGGTLAEVLWDLRVPGGAPVASIEDLPRLLQNVPAAVQCIVADLLQAMAAAAPILREASAWLSDEDRAFAIRMLGRIEPGPETLDESDTWRLLDIAARVDRGRLLAGAAIVGAAVDRAREALGRWKRAGKPGLAAGAPPQDRPDVAEGDVLLVAETSLGLVVVGGVGPTTYRRDAALIVDLGGGNTYLNRAGGTVGPAQPASIAIDLDGESRYVASADFAQGAAAFGVGMLMTLGGRNTYLARNFAQGSGLFGVGLLVDDGQGGAYEAGAYVQGAGVFGVGALVGEAGDGQFQATLYAQGFGMTGGLGLLLKEAGDDTYVIAGGPRDFREPDRAQSFGQGFGLGMRPLASGGIGLLARHAGRARFVAEYFAQGASYWLGLGALVNDANNGRYLARRYAQGAGIHLSVGILWAGGGDNLFSSWGVSQGCGHDFAVGILASGPGNDTYLSTWLSQGAASSDGIGLLVDLGGENRYLASGKDVQGHGRSARRSQSLGLLLDLGGKGSYSGPGKAGRRWDGFEYGGGLDAEGITLGFDLGPRRDPVAALGATPFGPKAPDGYPRPPDPRFATRDEAGRQVEALLRRAIEPLETPENTKAREEARRALIAVGREAVPALMDLLGSTQVLVVLETVDALVAIGGAAHPALMAGLEDPNWVLRRRAAHVLAQKPTPEIAPILAAKATGDPDPAVRAAAAEGIGRARPEGAASILAGLLEQDADPGVRHTAAVALGRLKDVAGLRALERALADPAFFVRLAARKALAATR